MASGDIRREHVLQAIARCEKVGRDKFLDDYRFGPALKYRLVHNGRFYDSKAIVGYAHGFATGVFWNGEMKFGGVGPGDAVPILEGLGFFVDRTGLLYRIENIKADHSQGKRAPYQYVLLLWAIAGARAGSPRLQHFRAARPEVVDTLKRFAMTRRPPAPEDPWAALANSGLWELVGHGLEKVTDVEVRRFDIVGGLTAEMYEASDDDAFVGAAVDVVAMAIAEERALPELLKMLGLDKSQRESAAVASPDFADVVDAIEEVTSPRRGGFGRHRSAAERKAIEECAVLVVRDHFENELGYRTEDVGTTESYDVRATKGDSVIKVEVKGTTSVGAAVVLTSNEVRLHRSGHPNNALAVVRRIILDSGGETPSATGGELVLTMPWKLEAERLEPIAYRYDTGS